MEQLFLDIHRALHDLNIRKLKITVDDKEQELVITEKGRQKMRYVILEKRNRQYEVIQQNIESSSPFGTRARNGEKISWIIPLQYNTRLRDNWLVITDTTKVTK